ncbi:hypothetical protein [Metallosphaera hakonensis]|uniref:hypothetical protein n=1 Tax=Metallosphaera hakonensis TaxID=79601 RepID=UPI000AB35703|nr:hypothetical protein [Metallosphaera hakonensis]
MKKIRRVYSFISVLNDVDTIISDIESISALFQLLESLGDMITIKISEEGCVNLDEVGIEQKYGRYVVSWLKVRGVETLLKGNQICRAN